MKIFLFLTYLVLLIGCIKESESNDPYLLKRQKMVEEQIRKRGITDERVLSAMLKVKRHLFVHEKVRDSAYEDYPLSIGYQQTISQPAIVGYMTEILQLKERDKVLEIGTGSGYQAAILAEIVKEVFTIEILEPLAQEANKRLKLLGYTNVYVRQGDGYKGWPEMAPFDAIIVTAAPKEVPQELVKQLKVGGRMIIPVGSISQYLYLITKTEQGIEQKNVLPVSFVPMVPSQETQSP